MSQLYGMSIRACTTWLTHCMILEDSSRLIFAPAVPVHQTSSPSCSPSCSYVLYQMTQHTLVKQTETLGGIYKAAFLKIFDLLEDSGWALKPEGEAGEPDEDSVSPAPADSGLGSYGNQY